MAVSILLFFCKDTVDNSIIITGNSVTYHNILSITFSSRPSQYNSSIQDNTFYYNSPYFIETASITKLSEEQFSPKKANDLLNNFILGLERTSKIEPLDISRHTEDDRVINRFITSTDFSTGLVEYWNLIVIKEYFVIMKLIPINKNNITNYDFIDSIKILY